MDILQNEMKKIATTTKAQGIMRLMEAIVTGIIDAVAVIAFVICVFGIIACGSGIHEVSRDSSDVAGWMILMLVFAGMGIVAGIVLVAIILVVGIAVLFGCIMSVKSSFKIVSNYKQNAWNQGWDYKKAIRKDNILKIITSILFIIGLLFGMLICFVEYGIVGILLLIPVGMEFSIMIISCINMSNLKRL